LKKRSKKLLLTAGFGTGSAKAPRSKSFFASFFSKKEALTYFPNVTFCKERALAINCHSGASRPLVSRKQESSHVTRRHLAKRFCSSQAVEG
jgi:hypothetical protein